MARGRTRQGRFRRSALPVLVALGLAAAPSMAEAQSWRVQGSWVAGQVGGGVLGPEFRIPLGEEPPLPLPGMPGSGPVEVTSRDWHLSAMLGVGANGAPPPDADGRIEPLLYMHGGVLYRTGRSVPGYVGLVGVSYLTVGALGPAVTVEAADVAALQLGALHADGAWRGHAALNVAVRFLRDLFGG